MSLTFLWNSLFEAELRGIYLIPVINRMMIHRFVELPERAEHQPAAY